MPDTEGILGYGIVFLGLVIIGGIIGSLSLPLFEGRFYISGIVLAIFGTGAGTLILSGRIN
jgi:hypothetical protein